MQAAFREHHGAAMRLLHAGHGDERARPGADATRTRPRSEIREGLEGNLCRCTGYHNIVKAIVAGAAADARRGAAGESGRRQRSDDDAIGDRRSRPPQGGLPLPHRPRQLHRRHQPAGSALRLYPALARTPTRRSTRIDTAAAAAAPGVVAVFTGADLAADGIGGLPCGWLIHSKDGSPMEEPPHPVLAHGKVRHVGDPVAVVIAETPAAGARRGRADRRRLRGAAGGRRPCATR